MAFCEVGVMDRARCSGVPEPPNRAPLGDPGIQVRGYGWVQARSSGQVSGPVQVSGSAVAGTGLANPARVKAVTRTPTRCFSPMFQHSVFI